MKRFLVMKRRRDWSEFYRISEELVHFSVSCDCTMCERIAVCNIGSVSVYLEWNSTFAVHSRNGSRINAQKRKVHACGTMRKFDTTVNDAVTSNFFFFSLPHAREAHNSCFHVELIPPPLHIPARRAFPASKLCKYFYAKLEHECTKYLKSIFFFI